MRSDNSLLPASALRGAAIEFSRLPIPFVVKYIFTVSCRIGRVKGHNILNI